MVLDHGQQRLGREPRCDVVGRDQEHGIAPADIAPRLSAQALLAMVENHITREVVLKRGDATESVRTLSELWWRAVYSRPGAAAPD